MELYGKYLPSDIKRHGRSLSYLSKWKATECRLFALYTGPIALKGVISDELYSHFLYYHGAITMLSSPNPSKANIDYAEKCLIYFVKKFTDLYCEEYLTYNIHSLIHLADECRSHGALERFSAFLFENFLGKNKKNLQNFANS